MNRNLAAQLQQKFSIRLVIRTQQLHGNWLKCITSVYIGIFDRLPMGRLEFAGLENGGLEFGGL